MSGPADQARERITDIPADPEACLRRYIGLWPDAPKDEYNAALEALRVVLEQRDEAMNEAHNEKVRRQLAEAHDEGFEEHVEELNERLARAEEALREAGDALDDVIPLAVSQWTGWSQADYDKWDAARAGVESYFAALPPEGQNG